MLLDFTDPDSTTCFFALPRRELTLYLLLCLLSTVFLRFIESSPDTLLLFVLLKLFLVPRSALIGSMLIKRLL